MRAHKSLGMLQQIVAAVVLVALPLSAPLHAQSPTTNVPPADTVDRCRPFDAPPLVVVTMRDGDRLHGTLTCLGSYAELVTEGKLTRTPLADVTKIAEPRDSIWNGPFIGAGFGALMWALCGRDCDSGYMARATLDYALLGLVVDAASSHNKTIYKAARGPGLSFRVRF